MEQTKEASKRNRGASERAPVTPVSTKRSRRRRRRRRNRTNNVPKKEENARKEIMKRHPFNNPEVFGVPKEEYYNAVKKAFPDEKQADDWMQAIDVMRARGPDLTRFGTSRADNGLFLPSASGAMKIVIPVDMEPFYAISISLISYALQKGWRQFVMNSGASNAIDIIYFAFVFVFKLLSSAADASTFDAPKVGIPDFLLDIIAAITPCTGNQIGSGTVGYSWLLQGPSTLPPSDGFDFPATGTQYGKYHFGVAGSGALVGGYDPMVFPTATYSAESGAEAYSNLVTFLNDRTKGYRVRGNYKPFALKDYEVEKSPLSRSASAFSTNSMIVGGGVSGGYPYSLASNEVYIQHPKFVVFAANVALDRGFRNYHVAGGDATYLPCSLINQLYKKEIKNPNNPCFKPVDFFEIADRVARFVAALFQLIYDDDGFVNKPVNLGMTSLDFLILMRHVLAGVFGATQYGVQSMRFYPNSNDDFIPFIVNPGTSSSATQHSIKFPIFLTENFNALRPRSAYVNFNPATGKLVRSNPKAWVPVLGQYTAAFFNEKVYTYTPTEGGSDVEVFLPGTISSYNLVDGRINDTFVDLDTSPKISALYDIWNNHMTTLSTYIQAPTDLSGDPGCPILSVIGDTFMLEKYKFEDKVKSDSSKVKNNNNAIRLKKKSVEEPEITVYSKKLVARICQQIPLNEVDAIKRVFVNPEYLILDSQTSIGDIEVTTMQSLNTEPWRINEGQRFPSSDSGTYTDMETLRDLQVANCVKNRSADNTTQVKIILRLLEMSRGGIFGDMAATLVGDLTYTGVKTLSTLVGL
jgi:hypothetical protein